MKEGETERRGRRENENENDYEERERLGAHVLDEGERAVLYGEDDGVFGGVPVGVKGDGAGDGAGLADAMLEALEGRLPGYEKEGWEIVFQLSGGFKSLNGFLQSYGMVRAHQCVYLFEGSSELVRIPRLPVRLELDRFDATWTDAFRRIEANYAVSPDAMTTVPGTLWATLDGRVALTQWGELVWSAARSAVYRTPGLATLSTRLVVAPAVNETLHTRSPVEVESANRSLDTVSAYLDGAVETMPASRQLKPLAGRGPGGATHELYAWSSHGAWRFYGRLEGELLFLDRLEGHL
jgi:hypothetical protein